MSIGRQDESDLEGSLGDAQHFNIYTPANSDDVPHYAIFPPPGSDDEKSTGRVSGCCPCAVQSVMCCVRCMKSRSEFAAEDYVKARCHDAHRGLSPSTESARLRDATSGVEAHRGISLRRMYTCCRGCYIVGAVADRHMTACCCVSARVWRTRVSSRVTIGIHCPSLGLHDLMLGCRHAVCGSGPQGLSCRIRAGGCSLVCWVADRHASQPRGIGLLCCRQRAVCARAMADSSRSAPGKSKSSRLRQAKRPGAHERRELRERQSMQQFDRPSQPSGPPQCQQPTAARLTTVQAGQLTETEHQQALTTLSAPSGALGRPVRSSDPFFWQFYDRRGNHRYDLVGRAWNDPVPERSASLPEEEQAKRKRPADGSFGSRVSTSADSSTPSTSDGERDEVESTDSSETRVVPYPYTIRAKLLEVLRRHAQEKSSHCPATGSHVLPSINCHVLNSKAQPRHECLECRRSAEGTVGLLAQRLIIPTHDSCEHPGRNGARIEGTLPQRDFAGVGEPASRDAKWRKTFPGTCMSGGGGPCQIFRPVHVISVPCILGAVGCQHAFRRVHAISLSCILEAVGYQHVFCHYTQGSGGLRSRELICNTATSLLVAKTGSTPG